MANAQNTYFTDTQTHKRTHYQDTGGSAHRLTLMLLSSCDCGCFFAFLAHVQNTNFWYEKPACPAGYICADAVPAIFWGGMVSSAIDGTTEPQSRDTTLRSLGQPIFSLSCALLLFLVCCMHFTPKRALSSFGTVRLVSPVYRSHTQTLDSHPRLPTIRGCFLFGTFWAVGGCSLSTCYYYGQRCQTRSNLAFEVSWGS